jgi:hypothetical protein
MDGALWRAPENGREPVMTLLARAKLSGLLAGTSVGAILCVGAAHAAVYSVLQSAPDVVTVLDPAAIETVGATAVRRAWSVSVKRSLTTGGPQQPGYVRTLNEYDCVGRRIRWKTFQVYSRFGESVMKKDNADDEWNPTPEQGEGARAVKVVCDGETGGSVVAAQSVSKLVITLMQTWDEAAPLPPLQKVEPMRDAKLKKKVAAHSAKPAAKPTKKP